MKLIKLSTDHYIMVDDSPIKDGDWALSKEGEIHNNYGWNFGDKKITHSTQPLEQINFVDEAEGIIPLKIKPLSLSEVKELTGEVDVEKKVRDYVQELIDCKSVKEHERTWISAICLSQMYAQCLEDNKDRKYYIEDVLPMLLDCINILKQCESTSIGQTQINIKIIQLQRLIQSLQPKTEWEVEIVDGKLKLKQ